MPLSWVISDVIGNGGPPSPRMTDLTGPFRPSVGVLGEFRALILPDRSWALVLTAADPAALAAETSWDVIGEGILKRVLTQQEANRLNQRLGRRGLPQVAAAGMTGREVVEAVAHELDPTFDTGWYPGAT